LWRNQLARVKERAEAKVKESESEQKQGGNHGRNGSKS
jgi:hypothetical protein